MNQTTLDRLQTEGAVPLDQVPDALAEIDPELRPHRTTVTAWVERGCSGIRLETWKIGRRRYTTRAALGRFIDRLSEAREDTRRRRHAEKSGARERVARRLR